VTVPLDSEADKAYVTISQLLDGLYSWEFQLLQLVRGQWRPDAVRLQTGWMVRWCIYALVGY
jgi:hypothetical protein